MKVFQFLHVKIVCNFAFHAGPQPSKIVGSAPSLGTPGFCRVQEEVAASVGLDRATVLGGLRDLGRAVAFF